jgi:hypothetical protein
MFCARLIENRLQHGRFFLNPDFFSDVLNSNLSLSVVFQTDHIMRLLVWPHSNARHSTIQTVLFHAARCLHCAETMRDRAAPVK